MTYYCGNQQLKENRQNIVMCYQDKSALFSQASYNNNIVMSVAREKLSDRGNDYQQLPIRVVGKWSIGIGGKKTNWFFVLPWCQ